MRIVRTVLVVVLLGVAALFGFEAGDEGLGPVSLHEDSFRIGEQVFAVKVPEGYTNVRAEHPRWVKAAQVGAGPATEVIAFYLPAERYTQFSKGIYTSGGRAITLSVETKMKDQALSRDDFREVQKVIQKIYSSDLQAVSARQNVGDAEGPDDSPSSGAEDGVVKGEIWYQEESITSVVNNTWSAVENDGRVQQYCDTRAVSVVHVLGKVISINSLESTFGDETTVECAHDVDSLKRISLDLARSILAANKQVELPASGSTP